MTTGRSRYQRLPRQAAIWDMLYGVPQLQGVQGTRLVILKEAGPLPRVLDGWPTGNDARTAVPLWSCYLITFSEPPVTAVDGHRYNGSYKPAE